MSRVDVLTVGECMVAFRCTGMIRLGGASVASIAGAEATVAIGLSRLGHRASWLGRLGADESGALVQRTLRAEGVDVRVVIDDVATTGLLISEQRLADVSRVEYHRTGSAGSRLVIEDLDGVLDSDPRSPCAPRLLHLTGITAALSPSARTFVEEAMARATVAGVQTCLDLNYRRALWPEDEAGPVLAALARQADIVIGSDDEFDLIGRSPAQLIAERPSEVIVKRGAQGAIGHFRERQPVEMPAKAVIAVDPIGAGDAFCAGYLSALLDGLDETERLRRAVTVAAFAVTTRGDWEGLPTQAELPLLDAAKGTVVR